MSISICTLAMSSSATSAAVAGIWAQALANQLVSFLEERGIGQANVRVVGGDGTNSVVGYNGGWMAKLEALLGRPLTRVVCLCHQAELPYRALVRALGGRVTSKSTFEGPIGQMLAGPVHELPLVEFQPLTSIELPLLPTEVEKSLSSDMRLLFQCAKCATTGDGSPVARRIHGQLNAARRYTVQSRLLRVYMAQQSPSRELTALALYIMAVYVPTVMAIKFRPDLL